MEKMRLFTIIAVVLTSLNAVLYGAEVYLNDLCESLADTSNKMWELKELMESGSCCECGCTLDDSDFKANMPKLLKEKLKFSGKSGSLELGPKIQACQNLNKYREIFRDFGSILKKKKPSKDANADSKCTCPPTCCKNRGSPTCKATTNSTCESPTSKIPQEKHSSQTCEPTTKPTCESPTPKILHEKGGSTTCGPTTNMVVQDLKDASNGLIIKGCSGSMFTTLVEPIIISEFSMKPCPAHIEIHHSPKEFTVLGHEVIGCGDGVPLGTYEFDIKKQGVQRFEVKNKYNVPFQAVQLRIINNHGGENFTCVNEFRVYGTPAWVCYP